MTFLAEALAARLSQFERPVVSNYEMFLEVWRIYAGKKVRYLRGEWPTREVFVRTRHLLRAEGVIRADPNYSRLWRIMSMSDLPADEVACIADPYCHISFLSAMQRYGLTDRRPSALLLTQPTVALIKTMNAARVKKDYGDFLDDADHYVEPLTVTRHPEYVRGRAVSVFSTAHYGASQLIKGTFSRVATIGQVFLDTLHQPERCGGMLHVLDVWNEHAPRYLQHIIAAVDEAPSAIHKVRAGYILEERLGISDPRISRWKLFAQRGGSRVLDPAKPFADRYSEDWMISINVD